MTDKNHCTDHSTGSIHDHISNAQQAAQASGQQKGAGDDDHIDQFTESLRESGDHRNNGKK